jgi:hypothetical protein
MSDFVSSEFIKQKWNLLEQNKPIYDAIKNACRKFKNGGLIWLKFASDKIDDMSWLPVERESSPWTYVISSQNNSYYMLRDYDPTKHYLIFLSAEHPIHGSFCQLVRLDNKV